MNKRKCIMFGLTTFAEMVRYYVEKYTDIEVIAYTVDAKYKKENIYDGLPVVAFEDMDGIYPSDESLVIIGLGYSKMNDLRKQKFIQVKEKGYKIEGFIHPSVIQDIGERGEGNIIFEGAVLGYNVKLGDGNIIWNGCNISHESVIGDFNHFSAGTTLGGKTIVKNNCFFGMNSVIRGPKIVEDYTLVGAGCYINNDTKAYGVYVPARSICLENKKSTDMM